MLALDAPPTSNFLDATVLSEVEARLAERSWGGLVSEDRLRRNLLSSQPLTFNLFGVLKHHPRALLRWVAGLGLDPVEIIDVRIEWAPPKDRHFGGGSAFDAAVLYRATSGGAGLVGVECKYAENLNAQSIKVRDPYVEATAANGAWRDGAAARLREPRLSQLWLNTLLAQSCVMTPEEQIDEAVVVVMACAADLAAKKATNDTRAELLDPVQWLLWCPYEAVLDAVRDVDGLRGWSDRFRERYLDFGPVTELLGPADARLEPSH